MENYPINTLESDSQHRYQWKLSRNLDNVSLFIKSEFRTKSVDKENLKLATVKDILRVYIVKSHFSCVLIF